MPPSNINLPGKTTTPKLNQNTLSFYRAPPILTLIAIIKMDIQLERRKRTEAKTTNTGYIAPRGVCFLMGCENDKPGSVGNTFQKTEKRQIVYCRVGTGEILMIISPLMELGTISPQFIWMPMKGGRVTEKINLKKGDNGRKRRHLILKLEKI